MCRNLRLNVFFLPLYGKGAIHQTLELPTLPQWVRGGLFLALYPEHQIPIVGRKWYNLIHSIKSVCLPRYRRDRFLFSDRYLMLDFWVVCRNTTPRCTCIFLHVPPILIIKRLRLSWALIILSICLLTCFFFAVTPHRVNTAVHLRIRDQFIFSHTTPD